MPDVETRRLQVKHYQQTITHLRQAGDAYLDWVVTVLFYTALHLVDQVLYRSARLNPRNHRQRHAGIVSDPALALVYGDCRELEHQSRRSRYECVRFTPAEVQGLSARLARIEQTVNASLPS